MGDMQFWNYISPYLPGATCFTTPETFLFFDNSPKRQRHALGSESKKVKLQGLCKTRWIERHATCYMKLFMTCIILSAVAVKQYS